LRLKDNPSPDPAQCGKPTALGTPFFIKKDDVDYIFCFLILKFFHKESIHSAKVFMNG